MSRCSCLAVTDTSKAIVLLLGVPVKRASLGPKAGGRYSSADIDFLGRVCCAGEPLVASFIGEEDSEERDGGFPAGVRGRARFTLIFGGLSGRLVNAGARRVWDLFLFWEAWAGIDRQQVLLRYGRDDEAVGVGGGCPVRRRRFLYVLNVARETPGHIRQLALNFQGLEGRRDHTSGWCCRCGWLRRIALAFVECHCRWSSVTFPQCSMGLVFAVWLGTGDSRRVDMISRKERGGKLCPMERWSKEKSTADV